MKVFAVTALFMGMLQLSAADLHAAPILLQIAPKSKACAGGTTAMAKECRTADQIAPYMITAMMEYGIYSTGEMAAIIADMAFESGEFVYKRNYYPGRPGQGTANMQQAKFNLEFAQSLPEIKPKVTITDVDTASNASLNAMRDLLIVDKYNFASGPWLFRTHCSDTVREQLQSSNPATKNTGFNTFVTDCISTTVTDDRLLYWYRAKNAFGLSDAADSAKLTQLEASVGSS